MLPTHLINIIKSYCNEDIKTDHCKSFLKAIHVNFPDDPTPLKNLFYLGNRFNDIWLQRKFIKYIPNRCICGTNIQKKHFFQHVSNKIIIVGGTCRKYFINYKRTCGVCRKVISGRISNYCSDCRGSRLSVGRHTGMFYRDILFNYQSYIHWVLSLSNPHGQIKELKSWVEKLMLKRKHRHLLAQ